jgi:phosphatidate cytidylyltransferase
MLKYRLIFGTIMSLLFVGLILLDGHLDGSLTASATDKPLQATILAALIFLLAIPAQLEMKGLVANIGAKLFTPLAIIFSMALSMTFYLGQFVDLGTVEIYLLYMLLLPAIGLLSIFLYQGIRYGTENAIVNCAVNFFSCFYLGFLACFVLGIRIQFGVWPLLMFICVIKSSDIGAYTLGRLFGKHKFAPRISPGKTWEGLGGAMLFATIVSVLFARFGGLMTMPAAIAFGLAFGVLGQLGDLAESMIKRDAQKKDSSTAVPGFGGVLDIIDSPLATAPLAFLYFVLFCAV